MGVSTNATPKRHTGHRARLALSPEQVSVLDDQAHAARTLWNLLHAWWTMASENRRVDLKDADAAIKQARKEIGFLKALPAQAAQAVLKTYFQAWRNCWDRRAEEPTFKSRLRSQMVVDIPQGRDLHLQRVHRRWGMVNIPKLGRVRFRGRGPASTVDARSAATTPPPTAAAMSSPGAPPGCHPPARDRESPSTSTGEGAVPSPCRRPPEWPPGSVRAGGAEPLESRWPVRASQENERSDRSL